MIGLCNMLVELEKTSSKNDKVDIIKRWHAGDPDEVGKFLLYALNPYQKYFIRKIPRHMPSPTSVHGFEDMTNLLDQLSHREVTGNDAIELVQRMLSRLDVGDGDLFQRMLTKDLKCKTSVGTVNKAVPNLVPEFDVQLAATWDAKKLTFPRIGEPKIDGMRCLAFIEGPEAHDIVFMSRSGKPIETLATVAESLIKIFPEGSVIDGEAKQVGITFEDTMSAVKRKKAKDDADITFFVFDLLTAEEFSKQLCAVPYEVRRTRFMSRIEAADLTNIKVLKNYYITDMAGVDEAYEDCRINKHEGIILKDPAGSYDFKRSRTWMKKKPFETMDVEITGYEEGKKGKRIGKLGAFTFQYNGELCRAGGGYSDAQLKEFWDNREQMVGDIMEVEFMEKTAKGKTRHCNFVKLRTFKGEKA